MGLITKPILVWIGLLTGLFLSSEGMSVLLARNLQKSPANPFASYTTILPGSASERYSCHFQVSEGREDHAVTCDLQFGQSRIASLTVLIRDRFSQEDTVRIERLWINDLAQWCRRPSIASVDGKTQIVRWLSFGDCMIFTPSGAFSTLLPVQYVLLSGE